jgi:hypothetical protein
MPSRDEAKTLLVAIDTTTLVGLRDRALIWGTTCPTTSPAVNPLSDPLWLVTDFVCCPLANSSILP